MYDRSITRLIKTDLDNKIVLLSGPRQCGKTTLAKSLDFSPTTYLNYDISRDRKTIREESWPRTDDLVVFDELHKMKKWKQWLKGVYDSDGTRPRILVTGSARMEVMKKTGDSLAGRHFHYRLHPLSLREISSQRPEKDLARLLERGGFPEPFLTKSPETAERWRRAHLDRILREDLIDLEVVRDLKSIEILTELLAERVSSPISMSSLARDLQVSSPTIKRWIGILESLYVIFTVTPYSRNIAKAILKEPKIYFYDIGAVTAGPAAKFENLVACHLLKRCHFLTDTKGLKMGLHYTKNKDRHEVDFLTTKNRAPEWLIEVKESDDHPSSSLKLFAQNIRPEKSLQVVKNLTRSKSWRKEVAIDVLPAHSWLAGLET